VKEVLIIRSASFQQLDQNLGALEAKFAGCRISMLTHEHGVKLAEKYKNISHIYIYPFVGGFNYRNKTRELRDKEFDAVIIPVTNVSGAGFFNVMLFSLTFMTKKRIVCNLVSDMREISKLDILGMGLKSFILSGLAKVLSTLFGVFVVALLPAKLKALEKKD